MTCYYEFNKPLLPYQFKGFIKVEPTTSSITIVIDNETEQVFLEEDNLLKHHSITDDGYIAIDFQTSTDHLHPAYADNEDFYIFNNVKCQYYNLKAQVQTHPLKLNKITPFQFSELGLWRTNYNDVDLLFLYTVTSCNKLYKIPFEVFLDLDKFKCELNQKPIPITFSQGMKYTIINNRIQKVMTNDNLSKSFNKLHNRLLYFNRLLVLFEENYDILL